MISIPSYQLHIDEEDQLTEKERSRESENEDQVRSESETKENIDRDA